jgi:hypothetical protein
MCCPSATKVRLASQLQFSLESEAASPGLGAVMARVTPLSYLISYFSAIHKHISNRGMCVLSKPDEEYYMSQLFSQVAHMLRLCIGTTQDGNFFRSRPQA